MNRKRLKIDQESYDRIVVKIDNAIETAIEIGAEVTQLELEDIKDDFQSSVVGQRAKNAE